MNPKDIPFNVRILDTNEIKLPVGRQIKTRDTFEGATQNFHPEGLFSIPIFGRIGSEERDRIFGYIELNTTILHPFIYRTLGRLKGLYKGIMEGRSYVIWDSEAKDFVQSDEINGDTGMHLFLSHWRDIKIKPTGSDIQAERIRFIETNMDRSLTSKVWVMPSGYRDVQINTEGRIEENEINDFYRRLIAIADTLPPRSDSPVIDTSRSALQRAFNELYAYVENLIAGKDKFIQGRYGRRSIANGTRNVLSSMDTASPYLGGPASVGLNHTMVGLYQASKGLLPVVKYGLQNGWLADVFYPEAQAAVLINTKTLKKERVELDAQTSDRWTSSDGIEKIITSLQEPALRSRPMMVKDHYVGLVYLGDDMTYKVFGDIDELPEGFSRENVYPLTYAEWLYLSLEDKWGTYGLYPTRYPVAGDGSIYPSFPFVKTTVVADTRRKLDENWEPTDTVLPSYPKRGETSYFDTMSPHFSRLAGLAGD